MLNACFRIPQPMKVCLYCPIVQYTLVATIKGGLSMYLNIMGCTFDSPTQWLSRLSHGSDYTLYWRSFRVHTVVHTITLLAHKYLPFWSVGCIQDWAHAINTQNVSATGLEKRHEDLQGCQCTCDEFCGPRPNDTDSSALPTDRKTAETGGWAIPLRNSYATIVCGPLLLPPEHPPRHLRKLKKKCESKLFLAAQFPVTVSLMKRLSTLIECMFPREPAYVVQLIRTSSSEVGTWVPFVPLTAEIKRTSWL